QVKSSSTLENLAIIPLDNREEALAQIEGFECRNREKSAYIKVLDNSRNISNRFTNVVPVLIVVPNFKQSIGYIDNANGKPKPPFALSMDMQLSDIADALADADELEAKNLDKAA